MASLAHALRVLAAAMSAFILGALYYSKGGLQPLWMTERARSGFSTVPPKHGAAAWLLSMAASVLATAALDALLTRLHAVDAASGAWEAALIGAGLIAPSYAITYAFSDLSAGLLAIDASFVVLQFGAYGAILRMW